MARIVDICYAQKTIQTQEGEIGILKKTIIALVTLGILMSNIKSSAEVAKGAQTVEIAEKKDIQTVKIDERLNIETPLYMPEPSIYEMADCIQESTAADKEEKAGIPEERTETHMRLSQMLTMQAPGLQSLGIADEQTPDDETVSDGEAADKEQAEEEHEYSDEEKEMIAYVVFAEARGECFEGMVAVAQVVLNRFESGKFGKSVKRVVYARHQFAVSKRYNDICMEAVEYAIDNRPYPKNMYFFQVSKRKKWRNFVYYRRIGNHSFYCSKN